MRIGFDAKRAFTNRAGLGNFSRNTINSLSQFFPEDEYFLFTPDAGQNLYTPPVKSAVILPKSIWWKTLKALWRRYHISKLLDRNQIDIFHGLSHELPVGIQFTNVKSIVTIHDLIFLRYPEYYHPTDRQIYQQKFSHACEMADRIHAISHQTKNDIVRFFNIPERKIEVIYQSCNPVYYQKVSESQKEMVQEKYKLPARFLLSVGTVEQRKNVIYTLKALLRYDIKVPLVVAGRHTKYMEEIEDFLFSNKNKIKVYFLTDTTNNELAALYQTAEMLVYPSVFEGFGLPVIEAQASGCPVITSRSSSMPEAGGKGAVYVNPVSDREIGQTIMKLLDDREYRDSIVEEGRKNAERFTPEVYTSQLHKLYERVYNV